MSCSLALLTRLTQRERDQRLTLIQRSQPMSAAKRTPDAALISRVSRADGAGVRVHVAGGAEVVSLRVVRIRGDIRLDVGARTRGVALDAVGARVQSCPVIARVLSLCAGSDERQRCSKD